MGPWPKHARRSFRVDKSGAITLPRSDVGLSSGTVKQIDTALVACFNDRYWDGFSAQDGEKMIAALCEQLGLLTSQKRVGEIELSLLVGRALLP